MGRPQKKPFDPNKTWAWYVVDLRQEYCWSSEIDYGARKLGRRKDSNYKKSSHVRVKIVGPLADTCSVKVHIGTQLDFTIYIDEQDDGSEFIGFISKNRDGLSISVWMPRQDAMFFHQLLLAGKCDELEITGTDLYRRQAAVRQVGLHHKYEYDD